ncbi:hypothetical protein FIBSPDRAFT_751933, partial [Athelia psychrophila]
MDISPEVGRIQSPIAQAQPWVPQVRCDSPLGSDAGINSSAPDLLEVIRHITKNENAQWRSSAQRALLVETLDMRSDVLAILPTNGGKSMAYIVPSVVEGGYTAAVIPLKSLMADTERKLRDMGVEFEKYRKGQPIGGEAKLILVSIESARTPEWRKAISELDNRVPHTRVLRIVIDEAHFAFTASDFRDALRNLKEMRTHSMQFVLLSATIPPRSENHV